MTRPRQRSAPKAGIEPRSAALEAKPLTTRPTKRLRRGAPRRGVWEGAFRKRENKMKPNPSQADVWADAERQVWVG